MEIWHLRGDIDDFSQDVPTAFFTAYPTREDLLEAGVNECDIEHLLDDGRYLRRVTLIENRPKGPSYWVAFNEDDSPSDHNRFSGKPTVADLKRLGCDCAEELHKKGVASGEDGEWYLSECFINSAGENG